MPRTKTPLTLEEVKAEVKSLLLDDKLNLLEDLKTSIDTEKALLKTQLEKIESTQSKLNGK